MRDLFDFGFNDLNHDGKIDVGERAYGFLEEMTAIFDKLMAMRYHRVNL